MTANWIEFGIGILLLIAPWTLGFSGLPLARWTDMLAGIALALMGLWAIYGRPSSSPAVQDEAPADVPVKIPVKVPVRTRRKKVEAASVNS